MVRWCLGDCANWNIYIFTNSHPLIEHSLPSQQVPCLENKSTCMLTLYNIISLQMYTHPLSWMLGHSVVSQNRPGAIEIFFWRRMASQASFLFIEYSLLHLHLCPENIWFSFYRNHIFCNTVLHKKACHIFLSLEWHVLQIFKVLNSSTITTLNFVSKSYLSDEVGDSPLRHSLADQSLCSFCHTFPGRPISVQFLPYIILIILSSTLSIS